MRFFLNIYKSKEFSFQIFFKGLQLYLTLTAIALAAFLVSLDGLIINVAIPTISGDLGVPEDVGTWLITVFSATSTLFVPVSGFLSLKIGDIKLFILGTIIFHLLSLGCAISSEFSPLLLFRMVQGAGAGLLVPVSLTLIINNFSPEKKSVAIGFWSFFVMVGPAMGPMVGGWFSAINWKWMFYLNLPIGFFSLAVVLVLLGEKKVETYAVRADPIGMTLLFVFVCSLQMAFNRWNIDDWFNSSFIVSLFIAAGISFILFIVWESFHPFPFIEISRFLKRSFIFPALTTALGMSIIFSSLVLDALWTQKVLGYTPFWAGLALAPVGIFPLIMYPIMGRFVNLIDLRLWVIISFLLYALTFYWLSQINLYTPFVRLALPRLIQGIGFAIFTVPNSIYVVKGVKPERLTATISLFSFIRMLFVGFSVAIAVTLWMFREAHYQSIIMNRTHATSANFQACLASLKTIARGEIQCFSIANSILESQAWTRALADIYYLYFFLFISLAALVLCYESPKKL